MVVWFLWQGLLGRRLDVLLGLLHDFADFVGGLLLVVVDTR